MRGRHHWGKFTQDGFDKARHHLLQAIALDPGFAAPHAALADVHIAFGAYGVVRPADAFGEAKASAERALELGPESRRCPPHVGIRTDVPVGLARRGGGVPGRAGRCARGDGSARSLRAVPNRSWPMR